VTRAVVAGALANKAGNGGEAWVRLSYVRGLERLGCEVLFVEQLDGESTPAARAWFNEVTTQFGLRAALVTADGGAVEGLLPGDMLDAAAGAELLLNVSGNVTWAPLLGAVRRRAFLDIDPGFTQAWQARLDGHDVHFTIGENVGLAGCGVPTCGIAWRPTRPPVVLADWPEAPQAELDRFTTVATWRPGHGGVELDGVAYGLKVHEFRKLIDLPRRTAHTFELALDIDPAEEADVALLRANGWELVDPEAVAGDPEAFRRYVQNSGAEFSPVQPVYAGTASGWFSDRSARYLASGKPVLVQDTASPLPAGEGLLTFATPAEAAAGAEEIERDYARHTRAARSLAEQYLDSDRILTALLEEALA
jgi:hypothetical protein